MSDSSSSTVVAISTPPGTGGIAVIRLSGSEALSIAQSAWNGADLCRVVSHSAHLGDILDGDGTILDTAVATVFKGPKSFTGEDTVEFSIHGSRWIQRRVVDRLVQLGAEPAGPGEFTRRAFINGRMDLAQAEAVADIIASSSRAAHRLAISQLRGDFSKRLDSLRDSLIQLASLLELELDFSEEDVEFADRSSLRSIADKTLGLIEKLADSYRAGRAFKDGVPVAIAGVPNAGKSTLLNRLLDDERAIVSDIPGTTRDLIEDTREIDGVLFRFIDTAGLRHTSDTIENIGIERARNAIDKAAIILWLIDPSQPLKPQTTQLDSVRANIQSNGTKLITLLTKSDKVVSHSDDGLAKNVPQISSLTDDGIPELQKLLVEAATSEYDPESELIVTSARHYTALNDGAAALRRAIDALNSNLTADFIAQDIREAIHHLSLLTGSITTPDLLTSIFTNFCIGK